MVLLQIPRLFIVLAHGFFHPFADTLRILSERYILQSIGLSPGRGRSGERQSGAG